MTQFDPLPVRPAVVDTYEWIDTSTLSDVVGRFARVQILLTLFDGEPDKWLEFIRAHGTERDRMFDLPFVYEVKAKMRLDPHFIDQARTLMRQLSAMFADSRPPS